MIAYKLLRKRKDGSLGPLFINRPQRIALHRWHEAINHPTKGFAERFGWHCMLEPKAPHLKTELKSGEQMVLCKVELFGPCYMYRRPESQDGEWVLCKGHMRVLEILS